MPAAARRMTGAAHLGSGVWIAGREGRGLGSSRSPSPAVIRGAVDVAYVVAAIALLAAFPGAAFIAVLTTLPLFAFLDRPVAIVLVPTVAAAMLGGVVVPMTRLLGPETIPFYALVSGGAAGLLGLLHLAKLKLVAKLQGRAGK